MALATLLWPTVACSGVSQQWTGPAGVEESWDEPLNWSGGGPALLDGVEICNGGIAVSTNTIPELSFLTIGFQYPIPPYCEGHLRCSDTDLTAPNFRLAFTLDGNATGSLHLTNGSLLIGEDPLGLTCGLVLSSGNAAGWISITNGNLEAQGMYVGSAQDGVDSAGLALSASGYLAVEGASAVVESKPTAYTSGYLIGCAGGLGYASSITATGSMSVSGNRLISPEYIEVGAVNASIGADVEACGDLAFYGTSTSAVLQTDWFNFGHVYAHGAFDGFARAVSSADISNAQIIGDDFDIGTAYAEIGTGTVQVGSNVSLDNCALHTDRITVGYLSAVSSPAEGLSLCQIDAFLDVHNSTVHVEDELCIGLEHVGDAWTNISAAVSGRLRSSSSLLTSGALECGIGSVLIFDIDGAQRGSGYGAIDTGSVQLAGAVEIRFSHSPSPGDIFDVIRMTSPTGSVDGVFSQVLITGVESSKVLAAWMVDSSGREVFRIIYQPAAVFVSAGINAGMPVFGISQLLPGIRYLLERRTLTSGGWETAEQFIADHHTIEVQPSIQGAGQFASYRLRKE